MAIIRMRVAYFLHVHSVLSDSIILPSESILNAGITAWHDAKAADLPYDACFVTVKQDFATLSTSNPPTDPDKLEQHTNLILLYTALGGGDWRNNDNWGYGDPCFYSWFGLECNCEGFVTKLILPDNRLSGNIPSALASLTSLKEIYFQTSTKAMHIYENIDANKLTGVVPSLSALINLEVLDVSFNLLTALPPDINSNINLQVLSASGNLLTTLPDSFGDLVNLEVFELNDNIIDAVWPVDEVCLLTNIYVFNIGNSSLEGEFYKPCLSNLDPLIFDVAAPHPAPLGRGAGLTGDVPIELSATWSRVRKGYFSIYHQFALGGHMKSTCVDLRYCRWYQFGSEEDLAWTNGTDVPTRVYDVIELSTEH